MKTLLLIAYLSLGKTYTLEVSLAQCLEAQKELANDDIKVLCL